ncbi:MAG: hypothetical protein AAGA16_06935 [Cyanobacteria bacterium P01_E01_bin.35]
MIHQRLILVSINNFSDTTVRYFQQNHILIGQPLTQRDYRPKTGLVFLNLALQHYEQALRLSLLPTPAPCSLFPVPCSLKDWQTSYQLEENNSVSLYT